MSARTDAGLRTLVIDMMSPRGHVRFNRFYLSQLFGPKARLFVAGNLVDQYESFDTSPLGANPCGSGIFERLMLALKVLRIVHNESPKQVLFLSYDLATAPLVSHALRWMGVKVFCFEHNTSPSSFARRLFHKLSTKGIKRFVYTPYLKDLYRSLGLNAEYIPLPCLPCEVEQDGILEWQSIITARKNNHIAVGLCASGSVTIAQMEEIARAYPNIFFVMKTNDSSDLPNLQCHPYFENYGYALEQCDFAVVPFVSEYKVSGPVFEAVAMGKPVLVLENRFGRYVKSVFPQQIFFPHEPVPSELGEFDFAQHNNNITLRILNSLSHK